MIEERSWGERDVCETRKKVIERKRWGTNKELRD